MKALLAYHSDPAIKRKYLARVRTHRKADDLIRGTYGGEGQSKSGWRGCAVGCTIHGSSHMRYETELGIPQALARIEDGIFEGLPDPKHLDWPEQFLKAIKPGADLSGVKDKFLYWLLIDPIDGVIKYAKTEASRKVIQSVGDLYARKIKGDSITTKEWNAAYAAAYAAADAAAAYAAYAAAHAAAHAAAAAAADDAAAAADDAAAAAADDAAAKKSAGGNARIRQAEKLIELLKECK